MTLKNVKNWHKGLSAVYALGVWTMIVSYGYYRYTGRLDDLPSQIEEESPDKTNPKNVFHQTAHTKTIIIYKNDFVPYTTRIYNFVQSFIGGPGSGDS
ncbi:small integral membrane protein 26-like [Nerophis lumbriciformis]|uniref:small integral membrane protein 26-like n=1 Tax=Nerophis lumbriciformis TaxID=546530 RepID=UPI002ADF4480|nr:small integral membrane protein 26-like [Nerophis lumbriciformis]